MTFPNRPMIPENSIRTTLPVKVDQQKIPDVLNELLRNPNVIEVHLWRSGGLIEVVVDYAVMTLGVQLAGINKQITDICSGRTDIVSAPS